VFPNPEKLLTLGYTFILQRGRFIPFTNKVLINEEQIIEACRKHDSFAQKLLYERYAPEMKVVCKRYISDPDELKDIMQEAFIRVFTKIKSFDNKGPFQAWLRRIFVNLCLDHLRKKRKGDTVCRLNDLSVFHMAECATFEEIEIDSRIDESEINKSKVDYNLIKNAEFSQEEIIETLDFLPFGFRTVFNLYCIEGYSHDEIAKTLGIDTNTSRSRLLRAKRILQDVLYKKSINKLSAKNV
jgi:RNA polymerase sigma-70 factor, ECF subfamily